MPISDVARAYHQTVVKEAGVGYEMIAGGGAGEVGDNHTAKIGEELFTGQFKFKVSNVQETQSYTERYGKEHYTITPDKGETLIVVDCRLKNGTKIKQNLVFSANETYGNSNTALTDDQEHSYAPISWHGNDFDGYDVHADETYPEGANVLPGAAIDFALVFAVPPGTHPKDLVFSILKYAERDKAKEKSVDVRVSLAS